MTYRTDPTLRGGGRALSMASETLASCSDAAGRHDSRSTCSNVLTCSAGSAWTPWGRASIRRSTWEHCQAPFLDDVRNDRDGFLADLRALVAGDTTGFPALGASCLYFDLVDRSCRTEDALAIIDGGIAFKRARGLPSASLTGYEWKRWVEVNGPETS
jgi:hypothetical protein